MALTRYKKNCHNMIQIISENFFLWDDEFLFRKFWTNLSYLYNMGEGTKKKINKKINKKNKASVKKPNINKSPFVEPDRASLSKDELESIQYYTDGNSLWINNYLLNENLEYLDTKDKQLLQNHIDNLMNVVKKSKKSIKKTTVYRGAQEKEIDDKLFKKTKKGEELPFKYRKRFISTTLSESKAIEFIEDDETCCLLKLILPKGTSGIFVNNLSVFSDLGEKEFILPPGCKFIVDKKEEKIINVSGRKITIFTAHLQKNSNIIF